MKALDELKIELYDLNALNAAGSLMGWDQQTFMPAGASEVRSEHVSVLTRMAHEKQTSMRFRALLEEAENTVEPGSDDADMLRVVRRDFDYATKLPGDFVEEKSRVTSRAHEIWVDARKQNDFSHFAPILEQIVEFERREADLLGYENTPYDALIERFEEGTSTAEAKRVFDQLVPATRELLDKIRNSPVNPDAEGLVGDWAPERQRPFTETIVQAVGFDFNRGRQDTAPHPFCSGTSRTDIRLTTRFLNNIESAIFGSLHEAGHGMYEQNQNPEWDRLPLSGGVSMGVHESQSRLWENIVGRSKAFWQRFLPELQEIFPELYRYDLDSWYAAINKVQPTLIRVEADEVTYNLHIAVRFELEQALMNKELSVHEIPEAWNSKYEEYLGIRPDSDSNGCLQDVHWSFGGFGYFPTYTYGNLLSHQIWAKLKQDIPNPDELIARGEFAPILNWLTENIYRWGKKYRPQELMLKVTGKSMNADDYIAAMNRKYGEIYQF
jgi:carboxypeptidase Taq